MKNILLVDDDHTFNFINKLTLERMNLANDIRTALNGQDALSLFGNYYKVALPDIILLDINMPIMDGFGFLEAFNRLVLPKKENVLIIVLTSSQNPNDILKAKEFGVKQYLSKPLNEESFRLAIANVA